MNRIEIPEELYRYKRGTQEIIEEQQTRTPITKLSWDKGIFLYLEDAEYPQKGMALPETLWSVNLAKRNFVEGLRLLSDWRFLPALFLLALTPKKSIEKLMKHYNELSWRAMKPFILKSEIATPVTKEIEKFLKTFLRELGIEDQRFAEIFAYCIEYDSAYRYRFEDILSNCNKNNFIKNPRKEFNRVSKIYVARECDGMVITKMGKFIKLVSLALLIPFVRKAFITAIKDADFSNLGLDEIDRYWVLLRKDGYKYMGKTDDERQVIVDEEGLSRPKMVTI